MVGVHHSDTTGQVRYFLAIHGLTNGIHIGGARLLNGLFPHGKADIGGFHRIVGDPFVITNIGMPFFNKGRIGVTIDTFKIVPGGQMTHQRSGVNPGQFFFPNRESNHRNIFSLNALVCQFFIERHIGIAINGRHNGGFLTGRSKGFYIRNNRLPVRMTKWRVVFHNVFVGNTFAVQICPQNLVGGTRINIIRPQQGKTLCAAAIFAHQVINSGNSLLVRRSPGIKHVARTFFTFKLHRIEQKTVIFFKDRQDRFARNRGPATENGGNLVFFQKFTRLFGKKRPIRSRVNHHSFDLFAQKAAFFVDVINQHQDRVLQRGFRNRHCSRERVQNANFDRFVGGLRWRHRHCRPRQRPRANDRLKRLLHFIASTANLLHRSGTSQNHAKF